LNFLDNSLDRPSGTITRPRDCANSDLLLTPGEFGRVRVNLQASHQVLLVPDAAVSVDQTDREVLVAGADGVLKEKKVQTGGLRYGLRVNLFRTSSFGPSCNRRTAGNTREEGIGQGGHDHRRFR